MSVKTITGRRGNRLAQKHFPRIIQELKSPADLIIPVTFGDFVPVAKPTVYYAASETESHYYLLYCFYHYRDYSTLPPPINKLDSHRHDFEGVLVCQRKGERSGLVFTRSHYTFIRGQFWRFPVVHIEAGGHAISPVNSLEIVNIVAGIRSGKKENVLIYDDANLRDMRSKSFQDRWGDIKRHFNSNKVMMPDEWNDSRIQRKYGRRTDGLVWRDPEEFVRRAKGVI